jgi:hypothetical protein
MDGGLAMWSESLKIRLSMTAVWLALAACLLLAARFTTPASATAVPTDVRQAPIAVPMVDEPATLIAKDAS